MNAAREVTKRNECGGSLLATLFVLIEMVLVFCALILALAFLLSLLGANPDAAFAKWIYAREATLMQPFNGLFPKIEPEGATTIHVSLLFGIFIYALIAAIFEGVARRLRRS